MRERYQWVWMVLGTLLAVRVTALNGEHAPPGRPTVDVPPVGSPPTVIVVSYGRKAEPPDPAMSQFEKIFEPTLRACGIPVKYLDDIPADNIKGPLREAIGKAEDATIFLNAHGGPMTVIENQKRRAIPYAVGSDRSPLGAIPGNRLLGRMYQVSSRIWNMSCHSDACSQRFACAGMACGEDTVALNGAGSGTDLIVNLLCDGFNGDCKLWQAVDRDASGKSDGTISGDELAGYFRSRESSATIRITEGQFPGEEAAVIEACKRESGTATKEFVGNAYHLEFSLAGANGEPFSGTTLEIEEDWGERPKEDFEKMLNEYGGDFKDFYRYENGHMYEKFLMAVDRNRPEPEFLPAELLKKTRDEVIDYVKSKYPGFPKACGKAEPRSYMEWQPEGSTEMYGPDDILEQFKKKFGFTRGDCKLVAKPVKDITCSFPAKTGKIFFPKYDPSTGFRRFDFYKPNPRNFSLTAERCAR